ncbi:Lipoprotein [Azospirillaceae bacterium]
MILSSRLSIVAIAAALTVSGCSMLSSSSTKERTGDLGCPQVGIIRDLSQITNFRPGKRDLADVISHAEIADFKGDCTYDGKGVSISVAVALVAERGPAFTGSQADYTYFVAIANPENRILAKQEFSTAVEFKNGAPRAGTREELTQAIPLAVDEDGRGYRVMLGFQLTPEQIEFNRRATAKK